jgi:hypothetical protein
MLYSTNVVTTTQECEILINDASSDLNRKVLRKAMVEGEISSASNMAGVLPTQRDLIQNQLTLKQAQLAALPAGSDTRELTYEINTLENKIISYSLRIENLTGSDILEKQFELAKLEAEILILTEYKTALETRKAEIQSSASAA